MLPSPTKMMIFPFVYTKAMVFISVVMFAMTAAVVADTPPQPPPAPFFSLLLLLLPLLFLLFTINYFYCY